MKKKKIITIAFIVMVSLVLVLSGCSKNTNKATSSEVTPNIVECELTSDGYYYIVDKNTDVVYICYTDCAHRFGMEVMVNRNGIPVTASQLGIKY